MYSLILATLFTFITGGDKSNVKQNNEDAQSFVLTFTQPNQQTEVYAQLLVESEVIQEAVQDLENLFALPQPIQIVFGSEIEGPQYYQGVIQMPYEFLMMNDQILTAAGTYETVEDQAIALIDVTEFVLYHEIGHALVDMLDLPILGKEEDAVDGFAALLSTTWNLDEVALATADVFDASSYLQSNSEISEAQFWDSHSLDEQRMFSIFCLIHGSDPQKHSTLLSDVGMPADQSNRCQYEYARIVRNWNRVLAGYIR